MLRSLLELVVPIPLDSLFHMTPKESLLLGIWSTALGLGLGLMIACAVAYVALLVWVARDAMARGMDGAVLWMLLVLFTGAFGLLVYVLARRDLDVLEHTPGRSEPLAAEQIVLREFSTASAG